MANWNRRLVGICIAGVATAAALAAQAADVHRLQQQREQQQLELQLKMQQQQDRVHHPALTPQAELQRRQLELSQQLRQQQLHQRQSRNAAVSALPSDDTGERARRELARERASRAGAEQLQEFEWERRSSTQRPSAPAAEAPR